MNLSNILKTKISRFLFFTGTIIIFTFPPFNNECSNRNKKWNSEYVPEYRFILSEPDVDCSFISNSRIEWGKVILELMLVSITSIGVGQLKRKGNNINESTK